MATFRNLRIYGQKSVSMYAQPDPANSQNGAGEERMSFLDSDTEV